MNPPILTSNAEPGPALRLAMETFAPRDPFHGWLGHLPMFFCSTPTLNSDLGESGLTNLLHRDNPGSSVSHLRRFMLEAATPLSLILIHFPDGGETSSKNETFKGAIPEYLRDRISHLMCFAGSSSEGTPILLNVLKPVWGKDSYSPLLLQTGTGGTDGHLVLNQPAARALCGGFSPLSLSDLSHTTGMQAHGVNFLLEAERFDANYDLRSIFDPVISKDFFTNGQYQLNLVEVPLALKGGNFSVVVPVEFLLAFAADLKRYFPHIEIPGSDYLTIETIDSSMKALGDLLDSSSIMGILQYNPKRPIMAGFKSAVAVLSKELAKRAPYVPTNVADEAISNFVRHFFAVEHSLLSDVLSNKEVSLEEYHQKLKATEFGKFFVPVDSIESFREKIVAERSRSAPSSAPFEFSNESSKSTTYLTLLAQMGSKLGHVLSQVTRNPERDILNPFPEILVLLSDYCADRNPELTMDSIKSCATDFVNIIFGAHRQLLSKIQSKISAISAPETAEDPVAGKYWEAYWIQARADLDKMKPFVHIDIGSAERSEIIGRALCPEIKLLFRLPFAGQLYRDELTFRASLPLHR